MERFTSWDGVEIVYDVWRAGGGTPVVLHHGFIADAAVNWVGPGVVAALAAAGRPVVALDARGHGRSGKPQDPASYGEAVMARDLRALLDRLGEPQVDLVGYSMGAVVALIAATQDPRIRRLVVGGVGVAVVELGGVDTRVLGTETLVAALRTDDPGAIDDPRGAEFRALADAIGADREALAAQAAAVHASPIPLARVTVPTLILAGDADPMAARPEVLAAALPDAEVRFVAGDHMTAVGDPAFTAGIVEFLSAA